MFTLMICYFFSLAAWAMCRHEAQHAREMITIYNDHDFKMNHGVLFSVYGRGMDKWAKFWAVAFWLNILAMAII